MLAGTTLCIKDINEKTKDKLNQMIQLFLENPMIMQNHIKNFKLRPKALSLIDYAFLFQNKETVNFLKPHFESHGVTVECDCASVVEYVVQHYDVEYINWALEKGLIAFGKGIPLTKLIAEHKGWQTAYALYQKFNPKQTKTELEVSPLNDTMSLTYSSNTAFSSLQNTPAVTPATTSNTIVQKEGCVSIREDVEEVYSTPLSTPITTSNEIPKVAKEEEEIYSTPLSTPIVASKVIERSENKENFNGNGLTVEAIMRTNDLDTIIPRSANLLRRFIK